MSVTSRSLQRIRRDQVQRWLPQLDEWLLGGAMYGVQHTWPQLYRCDGDGAFFVITDGDRLLSHCAVRITERCDRGTVARVALIGSVATDPAMRGQGLATEVLQHAVAAIADDTDTMLLWAEQPNLYARAGFAFSSTDRFLVVARPPRGDRDDVRIATIEDHTALHRLHESKPTRIVRSIQTMSTLLTTPGMTTVVLERDGAPVAYACTGKGADLYGHWHELGGSDADLAELLPVAMHIAEQTQAVLLLPPYRQELRERLQRITLDEADVAGPMVRGATSPGPCWIDGLDSV